MGGQIQSLIEDIKLRVRQGKKTRFSSLREKSLFWCRAFVAFE